MCGSTCSCFIKHAQESHVGRIIGLGESPLNSEAAFDVGSFAGGSVTDSDDFFTRVARHSNLTDFPQTFYRDGATLRWALEEVYSFLAPATQANARTNFVAPDANLEEDTNETLLEFKVNAPDFQIAHFPTQDEYSSTTRMLELLEKIEPYFTQCAPWEVLESSDCSSYNTNNRIYGHPCVNGLCFFL